MKPARQHLQDLRDELYAEVNDSTVDAMAIGYQRHLLRRLDEMLAPVAKVSVTIDYPLGARLVEKLLGHPDPDIAQLCHAVREALLNDLFPKKQL